MGWEETLLKELGREKSESYRALYLALGWFLTVALAIGTIIAKSISEIQADAKISPFWLLAMSSAIIITIKYYSRAMMDYVNMRVWSALFNKCASSLLAQDKDKMNIDHFARLYKTYVIDWNSITPRRKILRDTLDIGYGHLIFFELCLLDFTIYRMAQNGQYATIIGALLLMGIFVGYEVREFFKYRRFHYVEEPQFNEKQGGTIHNGLPGNVS